MRPRCAQSQGRITCRGMSCETRHCVQAYVRKMAICLLDISSKSGSPSSLELLQRCSLELTGFFTCYWCSNPQHVAIVHSLNMQTGLAFQEKPPEIVHEDLLVGNACLIACRQLTTTLLKNNAYMREMQPRSRQMLATGQSMQMADACKWQMHAMADARIGRCKQWQMNAMADASNGSCMQTADACKRQLTLAKSIAQDLCAHHIPPQC